MEIHDLKAGNKYQDGKGLYYQIICVGMNIEDREYMVAYQELFGKFLIWIKPYDDFIHQIKDGILLHHKEEYSDLLLQYELDGVSKVHSSPNVEEKIEEQKDQQIEHMGYHMVEHQIDDNKDDKKNQANSVKVEHQEDQVNALLIEFLEATSCQDKLEIITTNHSKLTDRLINEMAMSIDCIVEEGGIAERIQNLIVCLQTMIRFESRRLR